MDLARGLPMATLKPDTVGQEVAASSNGMQQLRLERLGGKTTKVARLGSAAAADHPLAINGAQWAAVNDQGIAVVLTSRRAEPRHELSVIAPGDQPLARLPTFADAACLKLSPDGRQVIVASDGGKVKRFALDGKRPADAVATQDFRDPRRDPVAACATGNGPDGTLVLATEEGQVRRYDAQARQWQPMSRLVPFALGGAALDLSIEGGSRFVAVLSTRRSAACRNGADGRAERALDTKLKAQAEALGAHKLNTDALQKVYGMAL